MDLEGCLNEVNRLCIYTLLYMALTHLLHNPVDYYVSVESESALALVLFFFFFLVCSQLMRVRSIGSTPRRNTRA